MNFLENYEELKKLMEVKIECEKPYLSHKLNKKAYFIPFKINSRRPLYENGFKNIIGEFTRILLDKKVRRDILKDEEIRKNIIKSNILPNIINKDNIIIDDEVDVKHLTKLLNEYLLNEKNELKISHPYLYLYILPNNKHLEGEKEAGLFLRDIFCSSNSNLADFYRSKKSSNILIELILNNLPHYLENYKTEQKYSSKLKYVNQLFNEDINFAIKNEKFFLDNMDNIFAYYYFFYNSQLILKISKRLNYDDDVEELFYLLDNERVSKNRETLNKGYSFLKNECNSTLPRLNLISQLNTLLGTECCLENELLERVNNLNEEDKQNFLFVLKKWIKDYRYIRNFEEIELPCDYKNLVNILLDSLKDNNRGVTKKSINLFTLNLEDLAKKYFLKRRGSYGYVLNMNRDMLLMITALCVKDEKIKLNDLFKEYENRGIFFDRYSKEEVVNFLTKLNLIDKKSDSGDAQYVKRVL